ncbi:endo-1,4-beta-xylanase [Bradyrhizobium sp. LHD-71]|uniref:endo-1,4-beta-xylanase n=1 Tax=Bradyrhizobium sp. LHD-71 TaxID=3072141 RepID=UPI00280FE6E8|nr:endo-1,4-beta-xylanase [Bradyrhizobium sp. LHD-71]MDQ8729768.1 endo-1,4-beta-xylanase [Bradyrhizobium sp. LHD-71]
MDVTLSRRQAMSVIAGAAIASTAAPVLAAEGSLSSIAAENGFVFGAAAGPVIDKDAAYRQLYLDHTKVITSDIALKMSRVAPRPGPLQFEAADRLHQFCVRHAISMRGHCLIWNEWVPDWIKSMSNSEREKFFDRYVDEVIGRYAGQFQSWDIVNEPFWPGHRAPGGYRLGPWYETFGPSYAKRTFLRAGSIDKRTKFVLNEAHAERDDDVGRGIRAGLLRLVDELKQAGAPLHAVGLQGHLQPRYPHDPGRFLEFVHALAARGVDIYITEFDVRDDTFPDDIRARDAMVADTAKRFLTNVFSVPAVKMLIAWQLADKYSFYYGAARQKNPQAARWPRPLPFDEGMQRKPLWFAIADSFKQARRA